MARSKFGAPTSDVSVTRVSLGLLGKRDSKMGEIIHVGGGANKFNPKPQTKNFPPLEFGMQIISFIGVK